MPTMIDTSKWVTGNEASQILSQNSGHPVSTAYVRRLAIDGAIRKMMLHGRLALYNRRDVESYRVKKRPEKKVKDAADALLEPWRVDVMTTVIVEREAERLGVPLDEEQIAAVREEILASLVKAKETGEAPKPNDE